MSKKIIFRWVKVALLLYAVIGIAWYYAQDRLVLHPVSMPRDKAFAFHQPIIELNLPYDAGTSLNILEFKATDRPVDSPAKGIVLYFHGSKGDNASNAADVFGFTAHGYEAWLMDYPGFGKSTGVFTEQDVYKYALVFYKLARSRWQPMQVVICGKGLGTGIAAQLASVRDCRQLILEDPYYSVISEFRRWLFLYPVGSMLHYHFPTYQYLPDVTAPITIFDGDSRLRRLLKPGDRYIEQSGDMAAALTE